MGKGTVPADAVAGRFTARRPVIRQVETFVLKLSVDPQGVYLGARPDGSQPSDDEGYVVRKPWRSLYSARYETVLVRITADDGTVGWGEALAPVGPEIVAMIIDRLLTPVLIGADPLPVRVRWAQLRDLMRERGHLAGHQADALAAVDIALWDLVGKLTDLPVHALLGGAFRDVVPVYVSGLPAATDAARADLARTWASRGAQAVKLHLGQGVETDLTTFDAVAAAAPELRIAVDAHWVYDRGEAIRLGRALDERRALFLEAPVAPEDVGGHAAVQQAIVTPVASGEALRNRYEFDQWILADACRIIQPDIARTGITEGMVIAELAAARHLHVALHHSVGSAPSFAAGVQVSAAIEHLLLFEYQPGPLSVAQHVVLEQLPVDPAGITVPTSPGLGIEIDDEFVLSHAIGPRRRENAQ